MNQPRPEPRSAADGAPTAARISHASWAVFLVFTLNGFAFASWASRLPTVRDKLDLEPNQMGLLLLFSAIGSICALPLAGLVVDRLGSRRAVETFAGVGGVGLLVVALSVAQESVGLARVGLFVAGVGIGVWDASMNLQGAHVEQQLGKAIMPRFHAGFSFGTVAGAGFGALFAALHVPVPLHLTIAVVVAVVGVLLAVRLFLPDPAHEHEPARVASDTTGDPADSFPTPGAAGDKGARRRRALQAWTEPRTLMIGLVVLGAALTEGAANDWVSLATVDGFDTSDSVGAVALGVFLVAMTAMRLLGTPLLDRFSRVLVLRALAASALLGVLAFALLPHLVGALVGVALWGIGAALGFPVGISAASDDPRRAAARVSVVTTIGYSAFFVGPPLIGFIAHHVGYRHALLFVGIPIALGLVVMNAVRPLPGAVGQGTEPATAP
ncbi:MFS transporter [Luteimicrobium album]|uniref:MFS transporter n=1 Tax=Luteimicrobium album TaxID=1054550 RepID=A0ABQ6HWM3_9MICO|nr:MFS transporter [Luteimicrobium album]GMA22760.1 MFS transporter [Luteimicrobium album]